LQRGAEVHSGALLLVAAALLIAATAGLGVLRLDMSFRPLFASGAEIAEPTREFEGVFGQSSGAWIATVIENAGVSTAELLRTSARLSEIAATVPGISEVMSLTSLAVPQWRDGRLAFVQPLPDYLFEAGEEAELERQYAELLDGTRFVAWLVSADGARLLVAARTELPLGDLDGRRAVVRELERRLQVGAPAGIRLYFTGVSVVELAYETRVLRDQAIATGVTSAMLCAVLFLCFRNVLAVVVCLVPVTLAVVATLGLAGWLGQPVTILNSVIPALVMAIGVADAVHMLTAWLQARAAGAGRADATAAMLRDTGRACFYTTVTTASGFLSLLSARLDAVASFGVLAAAGILVAWLANQVLLPWLLRRVDAGTALPDTHVNRLADRAILLSLGTALARPRAVLAGACLVTLVCILAIPSLIIDQRFNGELPAEHRVSVAQAVLERDFTGFLGPEISVRRADGGSMVDDQSLARLDRFSAALRALPDTRQTWSVRDLVPRGVAAAERSKVLHALREHPVTSRVTQELVSDGQDRLAVLVRTGDIGTRRAGEYFEAISRLLEESWGAGYETEIVGQWWLAQFGMRLLLRDMLSSIATAVLLVLPILWLAVPERRVFIAATLANVVPLLLPLAVMAMSGIPLRIGTVVVLAIAFGIVVDNTMHIGSRITAAGLSGDGVERMQQALHGTGRAVLFTTLALVGAFLSMLGNGLLAIRDMGIVAAVTFAAAAAADLLLLPAMCRLLQPDKQPQRAREPADCRAS
jgi:hypothetical protein